MFKAIPPVLFLVAIILSVAYFLNSDINPNVVSYDHSVVNVVRNNGGIRGVFTASNNYLGLLTLRFDNKDIIENKSTFRIKEANSADWYHVSNIDTVQYNIKPLYTFGLPVIIDSKNKTYQFEVSILDYVSGEPSLELSKQVPLITSRYIFPWKILFSDKDILFNFLKQKISYQLQSPNTLWVFFAYFLPLIGYILYINVLYKYFPITFHVKPFLLIILLGVGFDMFVLRNNYNILALILGLMWVFGISTHKIKPQTSILIALILLIWCPFFLVAHMEWVAEKSANWMFIFTTIGFIQYVFSDYCGDFKQ